MGKKIDDPQNRIEQHEPHRESEQERPKESRLGSAGPHLVFFQWFTIERDLAIAICRYFNFGPPGEIRTPDTQVRSLVLYPAELRAEARSLGLRVTKVKVQRH